MPIRPVRRPTSIPSTPTPAQPPQSPQRKRIRVKVEAPVPVEPLQPSPRARTRPPADVPPSDPNRNPDGSYIIGKYRPPPEHRFPPGVSGNKKGRPKEAKGVNTMTVEILGAKMPVRTASGERRMTTPEFALHKMRELVGKNNLRAILAVLDRWRQAVPDPVIDPKSSSPAPTQLTDTDRAILDMFAEDIRDQISRDADSEPDEPSS